MTTVHLAGAVHGVDLLLRPVQGSPSAPELRRLADVAVAADGDDWYQVAYDPTGPAGCLPDRPSPLRRPLWVQPDPDEPSGILVKRAPSWLDPVLWREPSPSEAAVLGAVRDGAAGDRVSVAARFSAGRVTKWTVILDRARRRRGMVELLAALLTDRRPGTAPVLTTRGRSDAPFGHRLERTPNPRPHRSAVIRSGALAWVDGSPDPQLCVVVTCSGSVPAGRGEVLVRHVGSTDEHLVDASRLRLFGAQAHARLGADFGDPS